MGHIDSNEITRVNNLIEYIEHSSIYRDDILLQEISIYCWIVYRQLYFYPF